MRERFKPSKESGVVMSAEPNTSHPWVLTDVSLIIKKVDLDPEAVSQRLGITATGVYRPEQGPQGRNRGREGIWRLQCDERTTRDFSEQLNTVLSATEEKRVEIRKLIMEGHEIHLSVYGFAGTGSVLPFSARDLDRISRLNLPLELSPNTNAR
ncbi:DUF4279 domain-containing protein [Streptomyces sioyaensis]|uniref:DUF4279 domain-containing protein n=1 Tax=Streptomyces sioyaensis TaxID=67364 RepID=UPI003D7243FA